MTKEDTARDRHVRVLPLRDPPRRRVVAATMAGGRTTQATGEMVDGARPRRSPDRPGQRLASPRMAARIIDGKAIAQHVRAEVKEDVADWVAKGNLEPGLATVLVGDDPGSAVYVGNKQKASAEVGIVGLDHRLPQDASHEEVETLIRQLAAAQRVSGILLQLPTPRQVDGQALTALIPAGKDVDGLTPISAGLLAQGRPGAAALHPVGRDGAAAPPRRPAAGRRGGRDRALGPRRPPARGAAAGRQRHRDRLPLPHPRPRRGLPPRRRAGRRGRPPAHDPGRVGQAGRDGDRRRDQPHRQRPRGRRRLRRRRPSAPG